MLIFNPEISRNSCKAFREAQRFASFAAKYKVVSSAYKEIFCSFWCSSMPFMFDSKS